MEQIKLISVTAVLTLLIWTMAHQLVSETTELDVTIYAQPVGDTGMTVETDPPGLDRFRLTVTGPKRIVDQIKDEVRAGQLPPLRIPVRDRAGGRYPVDVGEALAAYREQLRGLQIDRVSPPEVTVVIDHLQTVTMPVHVEPGLLDFDVPPQAEPQEVQVTISETALARLAHRRVPLSGDELFRNRPEGEQEISGVVLPTRLDGVEVRTEPATVTVRATLRKQSKTGTIPAVPVNVQASIENLNRFEIEARDEPTPITRAITVQGPPADVDSLVDGRTTVTGRIVLTGDLAALGGRVVELHPVFDLPAGVRLAAPVPPIELSLRPRNSQAGP